MSSEVVYVVLDVMADSKRGGLRVLMRGVFTEFEEANNVPLPEGGFRNVVSAFVDHMMPVEPGAFYLPEGIPDA